MAADSHHRIGPGFRAETAAGVFGDDAKILRLDAEHFRKALVDRALALQGTVEVALAVFPPGHAAAGFEAVVRRAGGDEGLLDDNRAFGKSRFDIAVGPAVGELHPLRFLAAAELFHLLRGPLDAGNAAADGGVLVRERPCLAQHIAVRVGVGPAFGQGLQRIGDEGSAFEFDPDALQGVLGNLIGNRGHGENRLADIGHIVPGEQGIVRGAGRWQVGGGDHAEHAIHAQGFAGVYANHPAARHRAGVQPAVDEPFGLEVLHVSGGAGDLAFDVRRGEILADMLESHDSNSAARMTPFR